MSRNARYLTKAAVAALASTLWGTTSAIAAAVHVAETANAGGQSTALVSAMLGVPSPDRAQGFGGFGRGLPDAMHIRPREGGVAGAPACGDETLTQSTDPFVIQPAISVTCLPAGNEGGSAEVSMARQFTFAEEFTLGCVTFGIQANTGGDWPVTVRLIPAPITTPYASLSPIFEADVLIPAGTAQELFTITVPTTTFSAGSPLIVELRHASRLIADGGDAGILLLGANSLGQSALSYVRGPACGLPDFLSLAFIGFPNVHLALSLASPASVGECGGGGSCFLPQGVPGCADVDCCTLICALDPFCCLVAWDEACASVAVVLCELPCANICPDPTVGESEVCGGFPTNDGCAGGNPLLADPVSCGDQVCSSYYWDGVNRDTDWYSLTLTEHTCVTWTVYANVPVDVFILEGTCPSPAVLATGVGECPIVATAKLPPGNYFLFVAPQMNQPPFGCNDIDLKGFYWGAITCEPCPSDCCPLPVGSLTLRTGQFRFQPGDPGQFDTGITAYTVYDDQTCFNTSLFAPGNGLAVVNSACGGLPARILGQYPGWVSGLPCDSLARWINHPLDPGTVGVGDSRSTLYCQPFNVNPSLFFTSVCLTFCWAVDDRLGDLPGGPMPVGVFIRNAFGTITPVPQLAGGVFSAQNGPITISLPPGAVTPGGNQLLVYQRDVGCVASGVIYSARFDFCVTDIDLPSPDLDCCNPNGPGFLDEGCSDVVCAIDPYCCDVWCDAWCEALATIHCPCCQTCVTPPEDLVSWWTFDEGAGATAFADSASGQTATAVNGPVITAGHVGNAVAFNGTFGQYVNVNSPLYDFQEKAFTIDAWFRWDGIGGDGGPFRPIFQLKGNPNSVGEVTLTVRNDGALELFLESDCLRSWYKSAPATISPGQWYHVAVTASACVCEPPDDICNCPGSAPAREYNVYLDSSVVISATDPAHCRAGSALGLRIGGNDLYESFVGRIDEVQVFKRELSQAEVASIYHAGTQGKCKHRCHVPWDRPFPTFPPLQNQVSVPITICNDSPIGAFFHVDLSAAPFLPMCNGPILTSFTTLSPNPIFVPANSCVPFWIRINRPAGLEPGMVSCYEACVTNLTTGMRVKCYGSVIREVIDWGTGPKTDPGCCISFPVEGGGDPVGPPVVGEPIDLSVVLSNPTDTLIAGDVRIRAVRSDMQPGEVPVSIDGLPIGVPKEESISIPPGGSVEIGVELTFLESWPLRFADLVFSTDLAGTGLHIDTWSFGLASGPPIPTALPCIGDLNSDGVVDGADLGLMLNSWGASGIADLNGDGVVDGADLGLMLNSWGPCS